MLTIRKEQIQIFEIAARSLFEDEMVAHSHEYSPKLCEVIGEEQLRLAVQGAMAKATQYGFTNRGPIRLFIELMFLFGSGFDTDPQYPALAKILNGSGDQMDRAEQMHEEVVNYLQKVCGPDDINMKKALDAFGEFARKPVTISSDDSITDMLNKLTLAFPQKAAYAGKDSLTALIGESRAAAKKYTFSTTQGQFLLLILMYAFGHGCIADPLYPWIERTLTDEKIINPTARAERLQRKAVTWLDHVLAEYNEGVQT